MQGEESKKWKGVHPWIWDWGLGLGIELLLLEFEPVGHAIRFIVTLEYN